MHVTNRGKVRLLGARYRAESQPANFYVALFTPASVPSPDTNVVGDLTQIAVGNGYANGGLQLTPNSTDFDVLTEDDSNDRALVQTKNIVWTASGGSIPASGSGARYAALTDDNATVANREIDAVWDLQSERTVSDGQDLTLVDPEIRLSEAA